jgi:ubiquinone/menaquinone biosynthesis C-methylase UbiE
MTTNPLDPGPEVRAVWTEDSEMRRARAHFPGHTHVDREQWGAHVRQMFGWDGFDSIYQAWLEWGCGGGAVASAILEERDPRVYHAIDVSDDALAECAKLDSAVVECRKPHETSSIPDASVRYIVSTAVFMHFPSFDYARAVLREMRRVAAPGSRGLISTRYYQPGDHYDPAALQPLSYAKAFKRFCAWQVADFWHELTAAGFTPREVVLEPETQFAWYRFGG